MKTLITSLFTVLLAAFVLFALPVSGEESVYEDTLRLHVLAASDSTEDQEAKLLVRDAILCEYGNELGSQESRASAERYVKENVDAIVETVEDTLRQHGLNYTVSVSVEKEWFESRTYDTLTLPAGEYTALKVTLGEGRGQNFFCMLYPAICVAPALGETVDPASEAYNEDAYLMLTRDGYGIKLRTLEILSGLFG